MEKTTMNDIIKKRDSTKVKILEKESTEKQKAIQEALAQVEKQFGKGTLRKLGDSIAEEFPHFPTNILALDLALGIGGFPKGRMVELYGPESSGKSSLALHTISQVQKKGGTAAYIDAEHALDPVFAKTLGVNIDDLLVAQPDNGEEALEIAESLIKSNAIDIIVIDSVTALVPRAELEGNMGDAQMGLQARLMSQACRKLTGVLSKSNSILFWINQLRSKIGGYGNPETTTGGNALKFYASVRLDVRRIEQIKKGEEVIGNKVKVKVVKNKVAPPFRQAEFDLFFDSGFDMEGSIFDIAVSKGIIDKSGAWFSYKGNKLGQGKANATTSMKASSQITEEVKTKVLELMKDAKDLNFGALKDEKASSEEKGESEVEGAGESETEEET